VTTSVGSGTRLGPYEIISALGAGGMGEVWKARDTRLDRSVAIKVLPADFAENEQLKARFEREAKTISQLNHPHICTLYDVGDGYLVMELLEGESLAERLTKGPLPIDQVLRYGIEIAEALEKAHKAGVVHRDLKPGNVMITKSGAMLLDFGLAKPSDAGFVNALTSLRTEKRSLTEEGAIVGTFQYMAPEQVEAGPVDARTDIFSLGAVLYEMASGRRAFDGRTKASLIASILTAEPPPIVSVQPLTPVAFDRVVRTCLAKEPDDRWQSAHDVALELRSIRESPATIAPAPRRRDRIVLASLIVALVAALLALGGLLTAGHWSKKEPDARVIRFEIPIPEKNLRSTYPTISPDGKFVTFTTATPGVTTLLWIRPIDGITARQVPGTEGSYFPFWSPDSRFIGFFANGKLKKVSVDGGVPETICDTLSNPRGGTWNRDNVILFSTAEADSGIQRVMASGGKPTPATTLNQRRKETNHRFPFFLPDGNHFLYLSRGLIAEEQGIFVGALTGGEPKRIARFLSNAIYSAGNILFCDADGLHAQRIDLDRLELVGSPILLAQGAAYVPQISFGMMGASDNGTLVYRTGSAGPPQMAWIDPSGKRLRGLGEGALAVISPDGKRVACERLDKDLASTDIWIVDVDSGITTRVTNDPRWDQWPVWSRDGNFLAYARGGMVLRKSLSGAGLEQPIAALPSGAVVTDWTPDGRFLIGHTFDVATNNDIFVVPLSPRGPLHKIISTTAAERWPRVSPDGRWVAFVSDETGVSEVYLQRFDPSGAPQQKIQISRGGGMLPHWSGDGKQIIYPDPLGNFSTVDVSLSSDPKATPPRRLFDQPYVGFFDVARNGNIVVCEPAGIAGEPVNVIINWPALLREK
jgi:serine/threonine protein kinase/Tol biopolymer transport system component